MVVVALFPCRRLLRLRCRSQALTTLLCTSPSPHARMRLLTHRHLWLLDAPTHARIDGTRRLAVATAEPPLFPSLFPLLHHLHTFKQILCRLHDMTGRLVVGSCVLPPSGDIARKRLTTSGASRCLACRLRILIAATRTACLIVQSAADHWSRALVLGSTFALGHFPPSGPATGERGPAVTPS